jgi:hypothetical protein
MGIMCAFWLLGAEGARAAVAAGVIQEMAVCAPSLQADDLEAVVGQFGRPVKTSVMSCDALDAQACVLKVEVET